MIKDRDLKTVAHPDFKNVIDKKLESFVSRFYSEVEGGDHLLKSKDINLEYYKRNVIEIILRLRMKRWIDALTIHYFTKHNPFLAKKWAAYTEDEMLHDEMFIKDLERLGVSHEEVYATDPMFSTKLLQGYFYYGLEHEGRPLASLSSSYFIEKMSIYTQPDWIENIEKRLGKGMAKGQHAHVSHDIEDDHSLFVWNVLMKFVESDQDKKKVEEHIENVFTLFCAFYTELYRNTIAKTESESAVVNVLTN